MPASQGEGWHQLASDGSGSNLGFVSVGAPVQQSKLLGEVAIYLPSFISFSFFFFDFL